MEQLFSTFNAVTDEQWKARITQDLKGTTFNDLSFTDRNGILVRPFYTTSDAEQPTPPAFTNPDWEIAVTIKVEGNETTANEAALEALLGGVNALRFDISGKVDLPRLLKDIDLAIIMTVFETDDSLQDFLNHFDDYLAASGMLRHHLNTYIICDPISRCADKIPDGRSIAENTERLMQGRIGHKNIAVNAATYTNAGATPVYELACTLAHLNEYLNLAGNNQETSRIEKIFITAATDTNFFEQIAKLRALRSLVACLLQAYGLDAGLHLQVVTGDLYRAPVDAYSNLLRDTIAGMAGVLGGCDSLIIHRFDAALREPTPFSSRLSRNQQHIFKEESYLQKVADAAHGSYFIENITQQLAENAWTAFQEIEKEGGWLSACEKDIPQRAVQGQANKLLEEYRQGTRVLAGVNKYQAKEEISKMLHYSNSTAGGRFPAINIAGEIMRDWAD